MKGIRYGPYHYPQWVKTKNLNPPPRLPRHPRAGEDPAYGAQRAKSAPGLLRGLRSLKWKSRPYLTFHFIIVS